MTDNSQDKVLPIASLAADPKNPRRIKGPASAGLGAALEMFGALDIVFNSRTGHLVSGHQRVRALRDSGALEVHRAGEWGYILHPKTGERFPVRFVDWDKDRERMANLTANNPHLQGEFTPDALDQIAALEQDPTFEVLQFGELNQALLAQFDPATGLGNAPGPGDGPANVTKMCSCPKCGFRFEV